MSELRSSRVTIRLLLLLRVQYYLQIGMDLNERRMMM